MKPYLATLVLLVALWEIYSLLPSRLPPHPASNDFVLGAIHVHSTYSDGGGSVEEIMKDAKAAGLDFVILTDHNNIRALQEGKEKSYDGADLFVETELSTHNGHLLAFYTHTPAKNIPESEIRQRGDDQFEGRRLLDEDAFIAVAHPNNIKNPWNRLDKFTDGIEIFNFDSFWQRQLYQDPLSFLLTSALFPLNPYLGALRFIHADEKNLKYWDQMNSISEGHFGMLAADAHSRVVLYPGMDVRWPSYRLTFRLGANAIFLEDVPKDFSERKRAIYESLRNGESAMVFQLAHPFAGNRWALQCGKQSHLSGSRIEASKDCRFQVSLPTTLPYPAVVRLLKNGVAIRVKRTTESQLEFDLDGAGTYRVEVWLQPRSPLRIAFRRDLPYVFYNPIYVR